MLCNRDADRIWCYYVSWLFLTPPPSPLIVSGASAAEEDAADASEDAAADARTGPLSSELTTQTARGAHLNLHEYVSVFVFFLPDKRKPLDDVPILENSGDQTSHSMLGDVVFGIMKLFLHFMNAVFSQGNTFRQ